MTRLPDSLYIVVLLFLLALGPPLMAQDASETVFASRREALINAIEADVRTTSRYLDRHALATPVLEAMRKVPRHRFVPEDLKSLAYENRPLPIGHGQTISQPYIVAIMTDLLTPRPADRVLEVGTGSGYQAAVLAEIVDKVYTIEIVEPLGREAGERLRRLGYDKVETRIGDGYYGWKEAAPFDGIVVTAAVSHIPPPLVGQLKPGGRMLVPLGGPFMVQQLVLVQKDEHGQLTTRQIIPVRFVPLTGDH